MNTRQQFYASAAPTSAQNLLARAFSGECSPRQAIKAKCLTCCNFVREEVTFCKVEICPLWAFRPFQKDAPLEEAEEV